MAEVKREPRKERPSVGGLRDILTIANQDPNYEYRWANSSKTGRVQWLQDKGWEIVTDDPQVGDKAVDSSTKVGSALTRHGGGNVVLLAMRIHKDWYDEDQARKQELVNAVEESMMGEARESRQWIDARRDPRGTVAKR